MRVSDLLAELGGEKLASAGEQASEPMEKLASELRACGAEMADSFVERCEVLFEKVAGDKARDKASSSHASAGGVTEPSNWSKIKEQLQGRRNGSVGDPDAGHTRAEQAYRHRIGREMGKGRESY